MSLYLYDNAIIEDIRRIFNDSRVHITIPDYEFSTLARIDKDRVTLPAISLVRTGWSLTDARPHTMKFDGATLRYEKDIKKFRSIQVIPIRINYLIDIWSKTRRENDDIMRELIFYYSTHPTLEITVPYDLNINHVFNIFFNNDIEDNSDIVSHKERGEYYRQTISMYTDDAYLWKSSARYPTVVSKLTVETMDQNELIGSDKVDRD